MDFNVSWKAMKYRSFIWNVTIVVICMIGEKRPFRDFDIFSRYFKCFKYFQPSGIFERNPRNSWDENFSTPHVPWKKQLGLCFNAQKNPKYYHKSHRVSKKIHFFYCLAYIPWKKETNFFGVIAVEKAQKSGYLLRGSELRAGFVRSTLTPCPGRGERIRTTPSQHLYHKKVSGSGRNPLTSPAIWRWSRPSLWGGSH